MLYPQICLDFFFLKYQFSAVAQSCLTLKPHGLHRASLSITNSWSLLKFMSIELVMPSYHLILCHPLLLLPSVFQHQGLFQRVGSLRWPTNIHLITQVHQIHKMQILLLCMRNGFLKCITV